ncbi:MAG: TM2 domain-containing protein [Flavipsychrobacter sp.]|nr:TM2 domain-containing protein [Flavipsychrobacter sp.]
MDSQKVDMYLMSHAKYFESHQIGLVRDMMLRADDSKLLNVQTVSLKDPTTILIVSILAGGLGIDRFMLGDTGMGIGKLLTCGGLGIWTIVDWFMVMPRARELNFQNISRALM